MKGERTGEIVLVCGDREWDSRARLFSVLDRIHEKREINAIVHGACRGADLMAEDWAKVREVAYVGFPARWETGTAGRGEGIIRNQRMLDIGKPTMVVAFHDDLDASKGTRDMIERARKAGVPVYHFTATDGRRA